MAAPATLKIDIIADATKALKAMGMVEEKAGSSKLSGLGKTVTGALGTAAIIGFGKASVTAAQESAVATARLDSVFASMGDTTGEASKAAQDYASSLSARIGVEDEAIMAGQAQLATFGAVSDATARQAGIFDRATQAGADLAATGFGSIESNAVALGKALQDPTKGMTALGRSGVTFTDAQKESIKQMQKSGDLLGAQKVVLGAVESQVKGTAEATATSTAKMGVKFGELQETIGNKLLPVIDKVVGFFTKYMDLLIPLGGVILGVVVAVKAYELASNLAAVAQGVWNAAQVVFNAVMAANPIMLVVLAIAALVAAVVIAYNKVGWFRDFVDKSWDAVVKAFDVLKDAAVAVFNWIKANWPLLLAILTGPFGIAVALIVSNWDTIKAGATAVWDWVKGKFDALVSFFQGLGSTVGAAIGAVVDWIKAPIQAAIDMYDKVKGKFDDLVSFLRGLVDQIGGVVGRIVAALKAPINAFIDGWNALHFTVGGGSVFGVDLPKVTIDTPNIPRLAQGGSVLRTGLAVVHAGEQFSGVGRSFGGQTVINVHVTTTGLGADSPQIQRAVVNALRGHVARNGALDFAVRTGS
jgi:hypothetical protein